MARNNNGFAYVIVLVLVIIVAAVGFTGWKIRGSLTSSGGPNMATLSGVVIEGPTTPVCRMGELCTQNVANHTLEAVNGAGQVIATTRTDDSGHYRFTLAVGHYSLVLVPRIGLGASAGRVDVKAGTNVFDLTVDTGIR